MKEKLIYNGLNISFDEDKEYWYTNIDPITGKQAEYRSVGENEIHNTSLKELKKMLDVMKRKKFERIPVFISAGNYRYGGGDDPRYLPQYAEGVLTSISPNGNAFVVKKGSKHGEKFFLGRYNSESIILDTPENRKVIAEIEAAGKKEWEAEKSKKELRKKLKFIDGKKVYKDIYGKELQ